MGPPMGPGRVCTSLAYRCTGVQEDKKRKREESSFGSPAWNSACAPPLLQAVETALQASKAQEASSLFPANATSGSAAAVPRMPKELFVLEDSSPQDWQQRTLVKHGLFSFVSYRYHPLTGAILLHELSFQTYYPSSYRCCPLTITATLQMLPSFRCHPNSGTSSLLGFAPLALLNEQLTVL